MGGPLECDAFVLSLPSLHHCRHRAPRLGKILVTSNEVTLSSSYMLLGIYQHGLNSGLGIVTVFFASTKVRV